MKTHCGWAPVVLSIHLLYTAYSCAGSLEPTTAVNQRGQGNPWSVHLRATYRDKQKKKQIDLASPQLIHSCVHATRLTFLSNEAACKTTLGTSLVYLAPAEINRHKCERKISMQTGLLVKHHKSARKGEKSNSASTELKPLTACEC